MLRKQADVSIIDREGIEADRYEGYRVAFEAAKSMRLVANSAMIKVYGLAEHRMKDAMINGKTLQLIVDDGILFSGSIVDIVPVEEATDAYVLFQAVDGDEFFYSSVNRSILANTSLSDLVKECVLYASSPLVCGHVSQRAGVIRLPRGVALHGSPTGILKAIAKQIDAAVFVINGSVHMVCADELVEPVATIMTDDIKGAIASDGRRMQVEFEINRHVEVGRVVEFEDGQEVRVEELLIKGDTKAPYWSMKIDGSLMLDDKPAAKAVWR